MSERLITSSFQLWESQDVALNKIVNIKNTEAKGRIRFSRSTIMRDAFENYLQKNYKDLIK